MSIVEGGAAFVFKLHACSRDEAEPVVDMVAAMSFLGSGRQTWLFWLFAIEGLWCYLSV